VAASLRGMGIGTQLMDEVEARLRAKGCLKCYLLVTTDNSEAGQYYRQRGWYHMQDIHLYGKDLQ
jgi:ribosomal protein S18 acetylase RimI-like enzyme